MAPPDDARLRHMLDAAREAVAFATGHQRADLDTNRMLTLSLVKLIEILGEAANQVTIRLAPHCRRFRGRRSCGCETA